MPTYRDEDVLQVFWDGPFDLAVVFGHSGFNHMGDCWKKFQDNVPDWATIRDPFRDLSGDPHEIGDRRWMTFVGPRKNNGLTDDQIHEALESSLSWAHQRGLVSVITNGIQDSDRGTTTEQKDASDNRRAQLIRKLVVKYEAESDLQITLTSLDGQYNRIAD